MRRGEDDQQVGIDVVWCPGCRDDTTVETVLLPGDPGTVGVCLECGDGIEMWWLSPTPAARGERRPPRAS